MARRHRHGAPALHAHPRLHRRRERHARPRGDQGRRRPRPGRRARSRCARSPTRFGFDVDPDALVEDLPVGVQQRVEIIKALSRDAKVLVFDEPTAVLTPQETDELMAIMRQLKESGTSIVFITHKLREVREVADRITVIRLGKVVGEASPTATNAELASLMVGRAVELTVAQGRRRSSGDAALVVEGLTRHRRRSAQIVVNDVSFDVRGGEILAIAGVQGNGQTELTEALARPRSRACTGSIKLDGDRARRRERARDPRRRRRLRARGPHRGRPGRRVHDRREPHARPHRRSRRSSRAGSLQRGVLADFADARRSRSSTSAPRASTRTVRHAVRRQPAEGRARPRAEPRPARCSSPRSRPAASTSARSSSSTSASSRRATPASR